MTQRNDKELLTRKSDQREARYLEATIGIDYEGNQLSATLN